MSSKRLGSATKGRLLRFLRDASVQRSDRHRGAEGIARDVHQVLVVRKEENLGRFPKLSEYAKPGGRTFIVEIDEQVVGDEWERRSPLQIVGNRRGSKRKIKLISSSGAHAGHMYGGAVGAHADQVSPVVLVKVNAKAGE